MVRDLERERYLSLAQRQIIDDFDEARRDLAQAEGDGWVPRIRWDMLYASLDEGGTDAQEAVYFLEEKTAQAWADMPAAKARRRARSEQDTWEAQALEIDTDLSMREMEDAYVGELVWLWHGTSSAVWPSIERHGIVMDPSDRSWSTTTPGFVFLTADPNNALSIYAKTAVQALGGHPMLLRVIVPWDELLWDEDDADLPSGRVQFMLARDVHPDEIMESDDVRVGGYP